MKKKRSTRSKDTRHNLFTLRTPATGGRRWLGEGGFINLRVLLALLFAFTGVALAIFAGRDFAVRPASEPDRYMPVPGSKPETEAAGLARLEQVPGMTV